jgi:hypothetical protein
MKRFGGFALVLALAGGWTAPPLARAQGTETAAVGDTSVAPEAETLPADTTPGDPPDSTPETPADSIADPAAPADSGEAVDSGETASSEGTAELPRKTLAINGYLTASYTYSNGHAGPAIVGRFYDRFQNEIDINAANVVFDLAPVTDKLDAGFKAEFLFGQNAAVTKSLGLDLGQNADLVQGYAILNLPLRGEGKYVQFRIGKMATLMGLEVIEDVLNPNLSVANQFVYVENFTNTGLRVDVKPSAVLDFQVAVFNGWDVVEDNNTRKSFMGRVGIAATPTTSIGLLGYFGPEQADATTNRYGGEVLLTQKLAGGRASLSFQGDYGEDEDLVAAGENAKWWGVGLWGTYDVTPSVGVALRGDYIDDRDGARTSGVLGFPASTEHKFGSATATLNIRAFPGALIRPEIRYDRSNLEVYGEDDPSKNQVSFGLGASYIF